MEKNLRDRLITVFLGVPVVLGMIFFVPQYNFIAFSIFLLAMTFIGFWFTAMIGMMVFILTLKGKKKINWIVAIVLCIGLGSLCYFGFTRGFNIPLPKGTLWESLGINML